MSLGLQVVAAGIAMAIAALPAQADIYKYVDEQGMVIWSTVPLAGKTPTLVVGDHGTTPRTPAPASPSTPTSPGPSVPATVERASTAPPSGGGVYKYEDDDGTTMLSTIPLPGRKLVAIIPAPAKLSPGLAPLSSPSSASAPATGGTPNFNVSRETQRGRDDLRRTILEDELAVEQKLLSTAESSCRSGQPVRLPEEPAGAFDERVKRCADSIRIHNSNIVALRQELTRVK